MSKESECPTDASNADHGQSSGDDPTRPARRQVLKRAATLATAIALGGETSAQDLKNATTPAGDRKVTLTSPTNGYFGSTCRQTIRRHALNSERRARQRRH